MKKIVEIVVLGVFFAVVGVAFLIGMMMVGFIGATPSRVAAPSYMERCAAVGFTAEQCRFMHGG